MAITKEEFNKINQTFASDIRAKMARDKITNRDIVARTGISIGTVHRVRNGLGSVSLEYAIVIADFLGIDLPYTKRNVA